MVAKKDDIDNTLTILDNGELAVLLTDSNFNYYMKSIKRFPILSPDEINELHSKYQLGDKKARDKIICSNLRLVVSIANKYKNYVSGLTCLDLIEIGNMVLLKALDTYDPTKAVFSTYVYFKIKYAIKREVKRQMVQEQAVVSLNDKVSKDSDTELIDFIIDTEDIYENKINDMEMISLLNKIKKILSPVEYYVIYNRSIADNRLSLETLEGKLNVCLERVRQLEARAKIKIQKYLEKKHNSNEGFDYDYNIRPISPMDILKYLYIKDYLNGIERKVYYENVFGDYKLTPKKITNYLKLTEQEYEDVVCSIKRKMAIIFKNIEKFQKYKEEMLSKYKTNIYNLYLLEQEEEKDINYELLNNVFSNLSYEGFISEYGKFLNSEDHMTINLLRKYFPVNERIEFDVYGYENKINRLLSNTFIKKDRIPVDKLYNSFLENSSLYTIDEQLFILGKIFNKRVNAKGFYFDINSLIMKLETSYYNVPTLNDYKINSYSYVKDDFDICDIESNLKYFTESERVLIQENLIDNLPIYQISIKHNIKISVLIEELTRIKGRIYELIHNPKTFKIDFIYYEKNKDNKNIPFYGNLKLAKKIFDLYFGYNGYCLSIKEICKELDSTLTEYDVRKILTTYLISICKFKDGYEKVHFYTNESIEIFLETLKFQLSEKKRRIYENYLEKQTNKDCYSVSPIPLKILFDLEKYKYGKRYFKMNQTNRSEVLYILNKYKDYLSDEIKRNLCLRFNISYRDYMNGRDLNHVYRILSDVYTKSLNRKAILKKVLKD